MSRRQKHAAPNAARAYGRLVLNSVKCEHMYHLASELGRLINSRVDTNEFVSQITAHSPSASPIILPTLVSSSTHVAVFRLLMDTILTPGIRKAISICFTELTATTLCMPIAAAILWKYTRSCHTRKGTHRSDEERTHIREKKNVNKKWARKTWGNIRHTSGRQSVRKSRQLVKDFIIYRK